VKSVGVDNQYTKKDNPQFTIVVVSEVWGSCSYCWYWWNCWPSLLYPICTL